MFNLLLDILASDHVWMNDMGARLTKTLAVALAALGCYFLMSSFVPEVIATFKTKNTVGINKMMFTLHFIVGTLFDIATLFWFIALLGFSKYENHQNNDLIITAICFLINNSVNASGQFYILLTKLKNAKEAQKLGISEAEHYEKYLAPKYQQA